MKMMLTKKLKAAPCLVDVAMGKVNRGSKTLFARSEKKATSFDQG